MPVGEDDLGRDDLEALLEVRRELGQSYDAALVDSFAERIERAVAQRVDTQLEDRRRSRDRDHDRDRRQFTVGIVSLGTGIPITAISAAITDLPGLVAAWAGIVGVNLAYALRSRRER